MTKYNNSKLKSRDRNEPNIIKAILAKIISGINVRGIYNSTLPTLINGDTAQLQLNDEGKLIVNTSGGIVTNANWKIGTEIGTVAYSTNVKITLGGAYPSITSDAQLNYVMTIPATGEAYTYQNGQDGVTMRHSAGEITISGAGTPFTSGDVYEVGINAPVRGYNSGDDSYLESRIDDPSFNKLQSILTESTNLTAATHYFPSEDGFTPDPHNDYSYTGELEEADVGETITMTLEITNDADTTPSNRTWGTAYFYDDENDTNINEIKVTGTGAADVKEFFVSLNKLNNHKVRWKVAVSQVTSNAVNIYERKKV